MYSTPADLFPACRLVFLGHTYHNRLLTTKFSAGHSLTIVGFERQKHGLANLLVFDPMFRDPPALARLIGQRFKHKSADESLKPYRRGSKYLRRYREFELLRCVTGIVS